jgi:2-iminobutanoate/2-iminopropanoate deaminase
MNKVPAPVGPYSPIVRAGDNRFVSGQIGVVDGELVDGLEAQVRTAIGNLQAVLQSEGCELSDIAKTTVFLTDMANFEPMNDIYAELFGHTRPARSTVAVAGLPRNALFEIEAIAYIPTSA